MGTDASETPRARAHHVPDPLIEVDLAIELEAVRASDSYRAADHAAKTIAKQPGVSVVLIALKPGGQDARAPCRRGDHGAGHRRPRRAHGGREAGCVDKWALTDRSARSGAPREGYERERVSLNDR